MDDGAVSQFCDISGASPRVAQHFLELAGGDLPQAIQLYFENPELQSSINAASSSTAAPPAASSSRRHAAAAPRRRPNTGREDGEGVIHIDSDDEGDQDDYMTIDDDDDDGPRGANDGFDAGETEAGRAARVAQESEDAAMAKRMQEELYGESGEAGAGGVRSPIARTTETLVDPYESWGGADEADYNYMEALRRRRQAQNQAPSPFDQNIWSDATPAPDGGTRPPFANGSHAARLADLFRPPYDIMSRYSWDDAREVGKENKKWILVNLQDMADFNCQALNRDVWKDEAVKAIVQENFIFLQYSKDSPLADQYINFYFPHRSHENPDNYPHVSIVDPRTGEQVKVWSGVPFPAPAEFHAQLAEFLDRYSLSANSKNPVAKSTPRKKTVDVDRMTEDEMLEMALKNSLEASGGSSKAPADVQDPDELTRSTGSLKGKAPEALSPGPSAAAREPTPSPAQTAFAQISSTNPHVEPANDPATTTRIQIRHPSGRVIRRFNLGDPVRRIYEWLKAEPLVEGMDGVEFELKRMPQGLDLIEKLDETVEEAGLKQGTIMVEFITE